MLFLYNLFVRLYGVAVYVASFWNGKAAAWRTGRKGLFERLRRTLRPSDKIIWVHCSSAGEFEQGKPLIQALKSRYPSYKVLVSFFSPSGYAVGERYKGADYVTYLPLDTHNNANRFVRLLQPELVIFIKYEFWHHHLRAVAHRRVPLLLVGAAFREEQVFFKPYGGFFRSLLRLFRFIFVQDGTSAQLLQRSGIRHVSVAGDPRFDRVQQIATSAADVPVAEAFAAGRAVVVAGSTWAEDEAMLAAYAAKHPEVKFIVAPHEVTANGLARLQKNFPDSCLYSRVQDELHPATGSNNDVASGNDPSKLQHSRVLIIDSVGLLSRLYQYAAVAYVGGGFTKDGIHNVLEAAVWGKPVVFGPNYKKYREASELIAAGGGFSVDGAGNFSTVAEGLFADETGRRQAGEKAAAYVRQATGATEEVMAWVQEKRLLTN